MFFLLFSLFAIPFPVNKDVYKMATWHNLVFSIKLIRSYVALNKVVY